MLTCSMNTKYIPKYIKIHKIYKSADGVSAKIIQTPLSNNVSDATFETGRYLVDGEDIICLSTQIGCNMGCAFCSTTKYFPGTKTRMLRNLTPEEIIEQASNAIHKIPLNKRSKGIVFSFMGIGEPFDNWLNVKATFGSLARIMPKPRITISTIGCNLDEIKNLAHEVARNKYNILIKLHVSLHGAQDEERLKIVPEAKPIRITINAAEYYYYVTGNPVKLNYVLVKNANDSLRNAHRLGKLLRCRTGLILKISDFNSINGAGVVPKEEADVFEEIVRGYGVKTCRFTSHGQDILAGCGQLVKGRVATNQSC